MSAVNTATALVAPERRFAALARPRVVSFTTDGFTTGLDGTRLHYYTVGEGGPAIVCCDGIGCDGYVWKYLAEDLAPTRKIVRWHYRGHGESGNPDSSRMTIADLVDDLFRVMDANHLEKAILAGHSLGVQVILEAQRRQPDRVIALMPMCGSYGRPLDTFHDSTVLHRILPVLTKLIDRFPRAAMAVWKQFDSELSYQVSLVMEVNRNLVRRRDFRGYFTHMSKMQPRLFVSLLADAAEHDTLPSLDQIRVPTLIIAGEHDGFTPKWLSAIMHARIPGSEICTVPSGTHTAPIEMPELVNLRVRRFLDERVLSLA
jgi:pimeloyl-ACP methyl ester carboxylesterase